MGIINNRVMVVVSHFPLADHHAKARELLGKLVTPIVKGTNFAETFCIGTSGSKVGWGEAEAHRDALAAFAEWIRTQPTPNSYAQCATVVFWESHGGDPITLETYEEEAGT